VGPFRSTCELPTSSPSSPHHGRADGRPTVPLPPPHPLCTHTRLDGYDSLVPSARTTPPIAVATTAATTAMRGAPNSAVIPSVRVAGGARARNPRARVTLRSCTLPLRAAKVALARVIPTPPTSTIENEDNGGERGRRWLPRSEGGGGETRLATKLHSRSTMAARDSLSLSLSLSQTRNSELRDAELSALISRIARAEDTGIASLIFRTLLRDAEYLLRPCLRGMFEREVLRFPFASYPSYQKFCLRYQRDLSFGLIRLVSSTALQMRFRCTVRCSSLWHSHTYELHRNSKAIPSARETSRAEP